MRYSFLCTCVPFRLSFVARNHRVAMPIYYSMLHDEHVRAAVPVFSRHDPSLYAVTISLDPRLRPNLQANEVLVSPVVIAQPHGVRFSSAWKAFLCVRHCAVLERCQILKVLCSNTDTHEEPVWEELQTKITHGNESALFEVEHFSLFAVVVVEPYPQTAVLLRKNEERRVAVSSVPKVFVDFPAGCVDRQTWVRLRVLYADLPYHHESEELPLASPVLQATPRGLYFRPSHCVRVQLPVPRGRDVFQQIGACTISVLYSNTEQGEPLCWKQLEGAVEIDEVRHFIIEVNYNIIWGSTQSFSCICRHAA